MERVGRVSKNALALISAKLVTSGLAFFLVLVINRELGPVRAGIYAYTFTMYTILGFIPDFGIGSISIRDVSQDPSRMRRYVRNIMGLRFLLGLGVFTILMITNFATALASSPMSANSVQKFWAVFIVAFCLLLEQPVSNTLAESFIAMERLGVVAFVYTMMAIIQVGLAIYVIFAGINPVLVFLVLVYLLIILYSIAQFNVFYRRMQRREIQVEAEAGDLALAQSLVQARDLSEEAPHESFMADSSYETISEKEDTPASPDGSDCLRIGKLGFDRDLWRYLLRSAWPLAVIAGGVTLYAYMDVPILSWLKGDREVGLYYAACVFAKAAIFLSLALNMAVLPAISKVAKEHRERLGDIWQRMLRYMLVASAIVTVAVPVLARPVLIIQKHQYLSAWHAVWLTMAALNFTYMSAVSFPFYVAIDKQKKATIVVLAGITIKLTVLLITVPLLGYTGAAITLLTTEIISFILYYRVLAPELGFRVNWLKTAGLPALCMATIYGVSFVLQWVFLHGNAKAADFLPALQYAAITFVVVAAVYAILVLSTRLVSRRGLRELNELMKVD